MNVLVAATALVAAVNAPRRRAACSIDDRPRAERRELAVAAGSLLVASCLVVALVADRLLGWLDVSAPNARIAAGMVVGLAGAADLLTRVPRAGAAPPGRRAAYAPMWFPVLWRPEVGFATLTLAEDHGVWPALLAAAVAAGTVVAVLARPPAPATDGALGRVLSALQVGAAVTLLVHGVLTV